MNNLFNNSKENKVKEREAKRKLLLSVPILIISWFTQQWGSSSGIIIIIIVEYTFSSFLIISLQFFPS